MLYKYWNGTYCLYTLGGVKIQQFFSAVISLLLMGSSLVFGDITYTLAPSVTNADPAIRDQITTSVAQAVKLYNEWGSFNKGLYIVYNPSVPTANAGYNGYIQFGGSRGTKTALHEISHTLGVGTVWPGWEDNILVIDGQWNQWTGFYATNKVEQFDGAGAVIYADNMHFWPYGLNYNEENRKAHIQIVANLREDMGRYDLLGITEEALPQSVASGGTAVFNIVAPQAASYAWYKQANGTPLTNGGDISGATTDTLTLSNVAATDEGYYYCVVSDLSLTSRPAWLSVDHKELYERKDCTLINVRGAENTEVGNKFLTGTNPPTIRALGFIDLANTDPTIAPDGDGLLQSHRVTLWRDSDGAKITEVTVPAGTAGYLINGFRYVAIPEGAITLAANTAYVVSADGTGLQDAWLDSEPWLTLSDYYIGGNDSTTWQGRWGTVGTRPASFNQTGTFYGLVNITSKTIHTPLCSAPTHLTATAGGDSVSLDWDDNTEPDLYGYNVYRSAAAGGPYTLVGTDVASSDFTDNTLPDNGTWYYVVTAVDTNASDSDNSNEDSATVSGVIINFFTTSYTGTRNNLTGWVGYEFTPSEDLTIKALGRSVSTSMLYNHDVKIWRVSDQAEVAAVTVTPSSAMDALWYANEALPSAVTLSSGVTYRIASYETSGGDAWRTSGSLYGNTAVATISTGVYGGGSYPASTNGGGGTGYVPATFFYGQPKLADFDNSGAVDIADLGILCSNWLQDAPAYDIAPEGGDGIINLLDFQVLAKEWTP